MISNKTVLRDSQDINLNEYFKQVHIQTILILLLSICVIYRLTIQLKRDQPTTKNQSTQSSIDSSL